MSEQKMVILDGNEAAASVAIDFPKLSRSTHYPRRHGRVADQWRSKERKISGAHCPSWKNCRAKAELRVLSMALAAGAFATTFTASQGLLLMIPNMYKIAGELTPAPCTSRPALWPRTRSPSSATTPTSWLAAPRAGPCSRPILCRKSPTWRSLRRCHLESRIPFIHFFDGFRTSHEVGKILPIEDETIRALLDDKYIIQFRQNALSPDRPSFAEPRRIPTSSSRARSLHADPRRGPRNRSVRHESLCSGHWPPLSLV